MRKIDSKKVIASLEHHKKMTVCNGCPYDKDEAQGGYCPIYNDAIALLKEQEPVEPGQDAGGIWHCGGCGAPVFTRARYCPNCGARMINEGEME